MRIHDYVNIDTTPRLVTVIAEGHAFIVDDCIVGRASDGREVSLGNFDFAPIHKAGIYIRPKYHAELVAFLARCERYLAAHPTPTDW